MDEAGGDVPGRGAILDRHRADGAPGPDCGTGPGQRGGPGPPGGVGGAQRHWGSRGQWRAWVSVRQRERVVLLVGLEDMKPEAVPRHH